MNSPPRILTIAGSAAGGSAGIQADLKTFQELDAYGMSVITAMVAKHPVTGKNVHLQSIETIEAQFDTAMTQIGVDVIKVGMLFSAEIIEKVAELIRNSMVKTIVIDPVMIGKFNSKLLADDAIEVLKEKLLPLATIITPNMPEATELLGGKEIQTKEELKQAAIEIQKFGFKNVLVKGGRLTGNAVDILYDGEAFLTAEASRIDTVNTSGAGCTYSAAIAAYLAHGKTIAEAVLLAKEFVTTAIAHGFSYNEHVGPTYHAALRKYGSTQRILTNN